MLTQTEIDNIIAIEPHKIGACDAKGKRKYDNNVIGFWYAYHMHEPKDREAFLKSYMESNHFLTRALNWGADRVNLQIIPENKLKALIEIEQQRAAIREGARLVPAPARPNEVDLSVAMTEAERKAGALARAQDDFFRKHNLDPHNPDHQMVAIMHLQEQEQNRHQHDELDEKYSDNRFSLSNISNTRQGSVSRHTVRPASTAVGIVQNGERVVGSDKSAMLR